jgi:hypothetical protein
MNADKRGSENRNDISDPRSSAFIRGLILFVLADVLLELFSMEFEDAR